MNEDRTHRANAVVHFDISGPHEEDLHRFYRDLLGWQVSPQGPGYALVQTPGGLGGAISNAPAASVCMGVAVPDIEQAVARASELGSDVVMPPTDNGWVTKAQVKDPAGNLLTLIQT
ncbi:VOC family protein [Actinomadura luteofluorescens]|uniref:Putative enzyme related to lactoylglutathione lyase n=1 Tax=Actinomadura luteofluorescens TaxID=46163 RepID=A0A7Y9JLN9_9ACTN|nr:VOC family protein [Actinomadura luteofluorescens]NYD51699.1 putative enzyme related to lactoylglutathione lyase [Actinomadura luteofluorescens]